MDSQREWSCHIDPCRSISSRRFNHGELGGQGLDTQVQALQACKRTKERERERETRRHRDTETQRWQTGIEYARHCLNIFQIPATAKCFRRCRCLDIHWWHSFFRYDPFQKRIFQEKTYHFMFSLLSHVESARALPLFSRGSPPFSWEFPPTKINIFLCKEE